MSMEAMRAWEEHSQAQGNTYIVGKQLAIHAERGTNLAWPGDGELQRSTRLSRRTVQRCLRELEVLREIVRQPAREGRRRVYLIDPAGRSQLVLFTAESATAGTFVPVAQSATGGTSKSLAQSATTGLECASHARAGSNHRKENNNTPLAPQGGDTPDLLVGAHQPTTPSVVVRAEPVGPARRRRRHARELRFLPGSPCPLQEPAAGQRELADRWAQLEQALRQRIGESAVSLWLAGAHLHQAGEQLELALHPELIGWTAARFGEAIAASAGTRVEIVACEAGTVRA